MAPISDQEGSKNKPNTQDAIKYLMKVKKIFKKTPDVYARFNEIMDDFKISKISVQEVRDEVVNLFHGHDDVLLGFNVFLPKKHKIIIPVHQRIQTPILSPVQLQEALIFVSLVKTRFAAEPSVYESFWKLLDIFKSNQKSWQEIYQEVEFLFKDHPDLLHGFMRFLPINNNFPGWQAGAYKQEDRSSDITVQIPQPVKVANLLEQNERTSKDSEVSDPSKGDERESDSNSTKQMRGNGSQSILHESSDEDRESLSGEPNNQNFKENILAHGGKNGPKLLQGVDEVREEERGEKKIKMSEKRTRTALLAKEEFDLRKPVYELDFSNCEQCTPSYCLLPEHFPVHPSSHRTEHEKSLLNDTCVLVTSGTEDYSFKHMQKNKYEERLFRCEDDRYEFDMLVESTKSTKDRIEDLMKMVEEGSTDLGVPNKIDDYLTPMNLRCIEKLYGDHGLDAIDVLRQNPEAALPVLLSRLKQKLQQWDHCCTDFNKVWYKVFAKNFHKSLDHRRFKVKQQDTKNLIPKALQAEINEKHDKNLGDDTNLLEIGAKSQFSRSKRSVSDTASALGGCNKQHSCINQSTESIVSSPNLCLLLN